MWACNPVNLMCLVLLIISNSILNDSIPNPNLLSKEPVLMYS